MINKHGHTTNPFGTASNKKNFSWDDCQVFKKQRKNVAELYAATISMWQNTN